MVSVVSFTLFLFGERTGWCFSLTELASAAAQCYGELGVLGGVDVFDGSVGGDDFPSDDALEFPVLAT